MNQPKVSIVIPVYKTEKYLQRCMDTVLNQTLREIEIIMVDDGSPDSCGRLCDEYAGRDSRVKVIHKQNEGLGFARNSGIEAATGEYVAFLDSDDYVDTRMYETMYEHAKSNKADSCICGFLRVKDGAVLAENKGELSGLYQGSSVLTDVYLNILGAEPACPKDFIVLWQSAWLSLYSLSIIRRHNIRFVSERVFMSEDILFNMDYYRLASSVYVLNHPLYYYCENGGSLTQAYRPDRYEQTRKIYIEEVRRIGMNRFEPDFLAEAKIRLQRTYLAKTRNCVTKICAAFPQYTKARGYIRDICRDSVLQGVLREYPAYKSPVKHRIFNWGLRRQLPWFLFVLRKLQNYL